MLHPPSLPKMSGDLSPQKSPQPADTLTFFGNGVITSSPHAPRPFVEITALPLTWRMHSFAGRQTSPSSGALKCPLDRSRKPGPSGGPDGTPAVSLARPSGTVKFRPPPNLNKPSVL